MRQKIAALADMQLSSQLQVVRAVTFATEYAHPTLVFEVISGVTRSN